MRYDLIIPIYNIQNELDHCLSSILHQTYDDFRVIMVDDGATDCSSMIAKEYARKDKRFEYYRKKHGGLSDARNFGLTKVMSEYLLFIDGDDFIEADTLAILDRELCMSCVDVLEFNGCYVEDGVKFGNLNTFYIDKGVIKSGKDYVIDNLRARGVIVAPVCLKVVRSSLILNHHHVFAKGMLHEDELWTPKLYFLANTVKYIDECLYNYVQREDSITHQADKGQRLRDLKNIYGQLETYYQSLDITKRQRNILKSCLSIQMAMTCYTYGEWKVTPQERNFIMRNARDIRSIGNMILFLMAPSQYETLSRVVKKLLKYDP